MAGGNFNDVYYVNNTDDVVIEAANAGIDTVVTTVNYTLSENNTIEVLYMLGSGLTGTGSDGTDNLTAAGGPNTLVGLGGDDRYYVRNTGDVVIEAANGGYGRRGRVRRLDAAGQPQHRAALHDWLRVDRHGLGRRRQVCTSNGGPNTLVGLGGDDVYYVNNAADVVTEAADGGTDIVQATVDYTLPAPTSRRCTWLAPD